jgi:signal transduction histidine kinase
MEKHARNTEGMELLNAELLATVSHELRSPLALVKGYASTLLRHERRLSRDERHQFLLAISEASNRIEVIIARLQEMSQLETGAIALMRSPVDLCSLIQESIMALQAGLLQHLPGHFTFTMRIQSLDGSQASGIPLILADRHRLREVMDNLLENAVIYTPDGGSITIVLQPVTLEQVQCEGGVQLHQVNVASIDEVPLPIAATPNMLEVCVCDTGIGIPDDHLERIFDRFHRVDLRLTRESNGLGIGLTICKRIVELHHGTMWAESVQGEGSVFHILLPIEEIHEYTLEHSVIQKHE